MLPLDKPFTRREFVEKGMTQRDFEAAWKAKYAAFANALGVRWDTTCADVSRTFFYPSCRPGEPRVAKKIDGTLLNLDAVPVEPAKPATSPTASVNAGKLPGDHRLKTWIAQYGATFEINTALRSRAPADIFRGGRAGNPGVHIACPFEDTHTAVGGTGTFVVNASENGGRGFAVHCCHEHCLRDRGDGKSVDRLIFLEKMLERGWLALEDLHNRQFGGGPVETTAHGRTQGRPHHLRVVDRDGRGLDAAVFQANVVAPGKLDFERLKALCKTQIEADVTSEQMGRFVESGQITVANLLESYRESEDDDPYESKLLDLARKKGGEGLSGHRVDAALDEIRKEFKVKQKTMERDFTDAERTIQERLSKMGLLSAEDTLLIPGLQEYADKFAIIRQGGKALIFDLQEPNLSQALMHSGDFQLAYRKEWFEVADANGGRKTIYPAEEFLRKPPKATKVYHGGFVFKPAGTVPANHFNLYRGMLIEPNSSGSCSLLHDLIREVWTRGDPAAEEWVLEWLMHIIARPGERADTSIAIRGRVWRWQELCIRQAPENDPRRDANKPDEREANLGGLQRGIDGQARRSSARSGLRGGQEGV